MFKAKSFALILALCAVSLCAGGAKKEFPTVRVTEIAGFRFTAATDRADSRAEVGDEVTLSVGAEAPKPCRFQVELYVNGDRKGAPRKIASGERTEYVVTAEQPGTVAVICTALQADGTYRRGPRNRRVAGGIGVLVSPDKIRPGNVEEPADFDEFWKARRAELDKVPVRADRTEVALAPEYAKVVCYDVKVDCAGGAPVSGYLCMPRNAKPKSLPALVKYHGAGVRSAVKRPAYAINAIAFDVNAHGIDNGKPLKFYNALNTGRLKGYSHFGFANAKDVYFIDMFMRVMRALDYVKSLPEWDGKTLIVQGQSQGGGQSLAAAGLDPQVTFCCASVPALCDLGGRSLGRRPGWPIASLPHKIQTDAAVRARTAYVDGVFFARRIKCPVYMSTGLVDNTCVSSAVFSAFNSIPAGVEKHMYINPSGNHDTSDSVEGDTVIRRILGAEPRR